MIKKIVLCAVTIILLGTILYPTISEYTEPPSTLDIILVEGQSNAENWLVATTLEELDETIGAPSKKVYFSANTVYSGDIETATKDYSVRDAHPSGWVTGGYEAPLGKLWTDTYHHDVLFINTGIGSSSVVQLSPGGQFYDYVETMIDSALSSDIVDSYEKINKIGWIWVQGEFDDTSFANYQGHFLELDAAMQEYGFSNCYLVKTRAADSLESIPALKDLATKRNDISFASVRSDGFRTDNGLLYFDNTHYTQEARNLIAKDLLDALPGEHDPSEKLFDPLLVIIPIILIAMLGVFVITRRRD